MSPLHAAWRLLPADARRRWLARGMAALAPRPGAPPFPSAQGVVVAGEVLRASGLGEGARLMHRALDLHGVPAMLADVGDTRPTLAATGALRAQRLPASAPLILHVNAPFVAQALRRLGAANVRGRPVVGYWAWELPVVPDLWRTGLPFVHEVWAPSEFAARALRTLVGMSSLPVRVVPHPVAMQPARPAPLGRAAFGLPADALVVLVSLNLASSFVRKNPLAAVAAFRAAFGDRRDRLLVLKVGGTADAAQDFATLRAAVDGAANIRLETRSLPSADNLALTACADILLSLHRSEGFGLVPAEAMLLGRPVVATGWSGNMDFMAPDAAALVGYRLVPAEDPRAVYAVPGARWAEPDVADAASWLTALAGDPARRAAMGAAGRRLVQARLGPERLLAAVQSLAPGAVAPQAA